MNFYKTISLFFILTCCPTLILFSQSTPKKNMLDVLNYELTLRVDIENETIQGLVNIDFLINPDEKEVVFDCGNLRITEILGNNVASYMQENRKVTISLDSRNERNNHIQITYSGSPSLGLVFLPKSKEVYTVFSTSQWMVCNDYPSDRAKFKINLSIPVDNKCIASGVLTHAADQDGSIQYTWVQDYESPSYTYGFAIGPFTKAQEVYKEISLAYYSSTYTVEELETIFLPTPEMIDFFEAKSGVPYPQSSYSQILIGNHYQEMSGFSVLKESYGKLVMNDSTETNLISHELAHQWWGNMITCENWNHFWLNEGLTTFMSAAFNEHKFGREQYESDINSYRKAYESIRDQGKDKALVFPDWSNPSSEDRNLVYFKGAYVIHLLRMELGESDFWDGLKFYSKKHFGRSVDTQDFQKAFEESTGRNLEAFFGKWIYATG